MDFDETVLSHESLCQEDTLTNLFLQVALQQQN